MLPLNKLKSGSFTLEFKRELPEKALREAILNAIIHRDYTGAQIQMRVWDDRIELWNDGELPFGQTIESLKETHSSKPRNRCIANVFYKAGFIESWGRGIDKICYGFKDKGFAEPEFSHNSGGVLVTLYRKKNEELFAGNEDVKLGENENEGISSEKATENEESDLKSSLKSNLKNEKSTVKVDDVTVNDTANVMVNVTVNDMVIKIIRENPDINVMEIAKIIQKSERQARRIISDLKNAGIIKHIGTDKNGHWEIITEENEANKPCRT